MSKVKAVKTVKDSYRFIITPACLTRAKVGKARQSRVRKISCLDDLEWWLEWYLAGQEKNPNHISVYLYVNKAVSAKCNLKINGSSFQRSFTHDFRQNESYGFHKFISRKELMPLFVNGELLLTCEVEFDIPVPTSFLAPRVMRYSDRIPTDFQIIVGENRLNVHKSLLSLASPVFNAMLSHDTAEAKRGNVNIVDFDFKVVKAAIEFCYGRELNRPSIKMIVGILRFADKYDIQSVIDELGKLPLLNLSTDTFATIMYYAYDCATDNLFEECCKFFKQHQDEIREKQSFLTLDPTVVAHLLEQTFNLTHFDVLRHAHANGITFILEPLDNSLVESLSLTNFCDVVSYAWDCSRDDLQKACGKFFNDNQADIRKMKAFYDLAPATMHGVMKMGFDIL